MQLINTPVTDTSNFDPYAIIKTGGGAAGLYQAGLDVAYSQAGITQGAELIAGTSVGSITAAMSVCFGSAEPEGPSSFMHTIKIWEKITGNSSVYKGGLNWLGLLGVVAGSKSILNRAPLKALMQEIFGQVTIQEMYERLHTHFAVCVANLNTKQIEIISTWDSRYADIKLIDALSASSGIPGVFDAIQLPVKGVKNPHWYVDGGLGANNPFIIINEFNMCFPEKAVKKAFTLYCYPEDVADLGVTHSTSDGKNYSKAKDALLAAIPTMMNAQEQILEKNIINSVNLGGPDVWARWPDTIPCDTLDFSKREKAMLQGYSDGVTGMGYSYKQRAMLHILDFLK